MKINVANIPDDGLELSAGKNREWLREILPPGGEITFSIDLISVHCSVSKIGKTVSLKLVIETEIGLECCRCLKAFDLPVYSEFKYTFVPSETASREEDVELSDEDLGFGYYKDDTIEVDPLILEQLILQVPMKPLCEESCKGLCPRCGIDLNVASCDHQTDIFDSPFAVLKKLKINSGKK